MSIFFISAIIGIAFHFAFLIYEPRRSRLFRRKTVRQIRQANTRDLKRLRCNAIVFAVTAPAFMLGLFLFRQQLYLLERNVTFLELLDMPVLGHFSFGLGFGITAGYWLRTIIFRKSHQEAGYREIALTALLGVLLLIGLVGERSLSRAFERLTTLEAAGVKIGFSALSTNDGSIGPAYDSIGPSSRTSIAESDGLTLVSLLYLADKGQKPQMRRDLDQIRLLVKTRTAEAVEIPAASDETDRIDNIVKPLVDCALRHSRLNGDSIRLANLLQPITAAMRTYVLRQEFGIKSNLDHSVIDVSQNVEALQRETHSSCSLDAYEYETALASFATPKQTDVYTYLSIAGLLAYEHRYAAAVAMTDRWLKKKRPRSDQNTILSIRVRGFLLSLLEEWLHGLDFVQPDKAILDYQLANIEEQIALFENANVVNAMDIVTSRMKSHADSDRHYVGGWLVFLPDDHAACILKKDEDDAKTALYLERSLISAKLNWITVALDNSEFSSKYSVKAKSYVRDLLNLDLSCLANIDDADSIDVMRKNTLEALARVSLAAYARPHRDVDEDGASMRHELERALQAVILADYLLDVPERNEDTEIRAQASRCTLEDIQEKPAALSKITTLPLDADVSPKCMLAPIVKNFTKQAKANLQVLKRQLKQALQSIN